MQNKRSGRCRQSCFYESGGSVSIYFIAITAAFLLLTALLIDFARVAAFRKQAELAVKSGARSVLSSYDPIVYAKYGLFIRGGEQAESLFRETVEGNSAAAVPGVFKFLDTRWEQTDVAESRPLAEHDVFRRQVLEEMKYKAPIDLSLEIGQRFRGVTHALKEATATVDVLERMRQAYDRREAAFDDALSNQERLGEAIRRMLGDQITYPPVNLSAGQPVGSVRNVAQAALQYDDYVSKRLQDEARRDVQRRKQQDKGKNEKTADTSAGTENDEGPLYEAVTSAYESGILSLASALSRNSEAIRTETEQLLTAAEEALSETKDANEQMSRIAEQAVSMSPQTSGSENREAADSVLTSEQSQSIVELRQTVDQLVLDLNFFEEFKAEILVQKTAGVDLANTAASFSSLAYSVPGSSGKSSELKAGANRLQTAYAEFVEAYGSGGSELEGRKAVLQAHRSRDSERKEQEREAKAAWAGATRFLGTLGGIPGSDEEKAEFEQLNGLFHNNLEWNNEQAEYAEAVHTNDPARGRDNAMSASSGLLDMLEASLLGTRDQLYFSEYTISRLSHYDPSYVKDLLGGGEAPLTLQQQETEYVLYGLNNPAANIAAAYSELFGFRLAVRTMEGLIECRTLGHPLLVLAAALVYGIRNAIMDIQLLIQQGTVQLSKYVKIDTVYTDYLRVFLLLHGGTSAHTARVIAVMEHNTGVSLSGAYTYVSGEGRASISLWFFPGLLQVLGRAGSLGGTVKGSRYESTYTADSSYQ
ncbi:hypothetical protein SD71_10900 [Cohnella kolymensis]|uniref:Flp pilus-assembly TadG-like N-terminal domain-containing protein n=1 Tax=Cohnella kolymensis TaxID=1590652 RepID=A0ABR5A555_9BACL|nr:hypothetical protein [Cohnella kolymensis]KIL35888.1 hypothetical protein SD71_10900 [Cohnella kolymensis]